MTLASKYSIKTATNPSLPQRLVQVGTAGENQVEVATLFDPSEDRWVTHTYVTAADGVRRKLPMADNLADSEREAFQMGWIHVDAFFAS